MKISHPARGEEDDMLVTETRRLRDELLKNTARLQAFADQLSTTAAELLNEVGETSGAE